MEMTYTDKDKWIILQEKLQQTQVETAFSVFRQHGIEPILIKGLAISRLYPNNKYRISFDIDLAVDPNLYDDALRLLRSKELLKINIDLHKGLKHLDTLEWRLLFERSKLIILDKLPIRVLAEEDHLRILCVHWLTDGAENKEKLWDIYYAVENRSENFDWDLCFKNIGSKRIDWVIYTIGIANRYLGLEIKNLPFYKQSENLPKWLIKVINKLWSREYQFIPLVSCLSDPYMFFYQLRHRFPPNPIMATIYVEGKLNSKTRIFYQAEFFIKRAKPSFKSLITSIFKSNFQST